MQNAASKYDHLFTVHLPTVHVLDQHMQICSSWFVRSQLNRVTLSTPPNKRKMATTVVLQYFECTEYNFAYAYSHADRFTRTQLSQSTNNIHANTQSDVVCIVY